MAQKLGVDVQVDKDGKRIAFHHGGLDRLPDFIQMTLAKAPTTDGNGKFLRACGPANPAATDPTCMPPLIRFDSKSDAVLAGLFDFGVPGDLNTVDSAIPNGTIVPLAAVPPLAASDPNTWNEWGADPKGIRARLNTFEETTPDGPQSRVAVKVGARLDVPKSMTIDQVQSWSTPDGVEDEAKDIKFHVTIRDGKRRGRIEHRPSRGHDQPEGRQADPGRQQRRRERQPRLRRSRRAGSRLLPAPPQRARRRRAPIPRSTACSPRSTGASAAT